MKTAQNARRAKKGLFRAPDPRNGQKPLKHPCKTLQRGSGGLAATLKLNRGGNHE